MGCHKNTIAITDFLRIDCPQSTTQIGRLPRAVEVMQHYEPVLHIRPVAHLEGGADEDAHFALPRLRDKLFLARFRARVVDERYLAFRHPALDELRLNVVVDVETPVAAWRGEVAEY